MNIDSNKSVEMQEFSTISATNVESTNVEATTCNGRKYQKIKKFFCRYVLPQLLNLAFTVAGVALGVLTGNPFVVGGALLAGGIQAIAIPAIHFQRFNNLSPDSSIALTIRNVFYCPPIMIGVALGGVIANITNPALIAATAVIGTTTILACMACLYFNGKLCQDEAGA